MMCYHELTYTTEDSGVLTIVAFLWCCIIAQLMISALKRCLVRLYLHLLVGGLMFYLHYLCYLRIVVSNTSCGVQHVMWCLTRLVVSNTSCGVQHVMWCLTRIVVSNTYCGVQHVLWCLTRHVVSNTSCGV